MMITKLFGDGRTAQVDLPDSLASQNGEPIEIHIEWDPDTPPDDWEYATEYQAWLNSELGPRLPDDGAAIRVADQIMTSDDGYRMVAHAITQGAIDDEVSQVLDSYRAADQVGFHYHSVILATAQHLVSILYSATPDDDGLTIEERVEQVTGIARHLVSAFHNPSISENEVDDIELPDWLLPPKEDD